MPKAIDFASLLQLGAGLGIGLSFFRAGFDRKQKSLRRRFGQASTAFGNPATQAERRDLKEVAAVRARFASGCRDAEKWTLAFQAAALFGGLLNMVLLVLATIYDDFELSKCGVAGAIWWSVGYFLALLAVSELWLWGRFATIDRDLAALEAKKDLS